MAIRGGTIIGPGNAIGSGLYLKLSGTRYGTQMPPTGSLKPEQIELIKNWIDQGAEWPDEVSGDRPATPADPRSARMIEALRSGDSKAFERALNGQPVAANARGVGGSTPLMYAALYGTLDSVRQLLDHGADPNLANDAGSTALTWAIDDLEKARLLLDRGASVRARSPEEFSPITAALRTKDPFSALQLLIDHGLKLDKLTRPEQQRLATLGGNELALRTLMQHGVQAKSLAGGLSAAFDAKCAACVSLLLPAAPKDALDNVLLQEAATDPRAVRELLEAGASPTASFTGLGFTPLMFAAGSETGAIENVKLLIAHGADVNAKTADGVTALDIAVRQGRADAMETLRSAGALEGLPQPHTPKSKPAASAAAAVNRAIPLLQRTDVQFFRKAGCVSCHNNSLAALTMADARKRGVAIDENIARLQVRAIAAYLERNREQALQGRSIPGGADTLGYVLAGLAAEKYVPDAATDSFARILKAEQETDGSWRSFGGRPPIEGSDIECTAMAMRALQFYGIRTRQVEYDRMVERAAGWLAGTQTKTTEDRAFQLLGLTWSKAAAELIRKSAAALIEEQRQDGGWAQLTTLSSDAYATGEALVALNESGALTSSSPAYRRGVEYLLSTQLEDGSWFVRSRSTIPFQPYFDAGFPHGRDQFISAAATNWATRALIVAMR